MATRSAARSIMDELDRPATTADTDLILLKTSLTDNIRTDVKNHATADKSRKLCEETARQQCRAAIEAKLKKAVAAVADHSLRPVTADDVKNAIGSDWTEKTESNINRFIKQSFPHRSTQDRSSHCPAGH